MPKNNGPETKVPPKRAALYVRVSTKRQAEEGLSLEVQRESGAVYVEAQGWELVAEYVERGVSGKKDDRAELARAMRDATAGRLDVLVIPKLDRLGRSATHLHKNFGLLDDAGVMLVSMKENIDTSTSIGRLLRNVLAALADFEGDVIGERVAAIQEARREQGLHNGKASFGFITEKGRWFPHPTQADVVRRIFREYSEGKKQAEIARGLRHDGIPSKTGGKWVQGTLSKVLKNGSYVGLGEDGSPCGCGHAGLIDAATWERAKVLLAAGVRHTRGGGGQGRRPKGNHLFIQGLLRCGDCGEAMLPRSAGDFYFCASNKNDGKDHCAQPRWPRALVDGPVIDAFHKLHTNVEAMRRDYAAAADGRLREITSQAQQAERDLMDNERKLALIERDYLAGTLPAPDWVRLRGTLEADLEASRARADQLAGNRAAVEKAATLTDAEEQALRFLARTRAAGVSSVLDPEAVEAQRAALLTLFESFTLHPALTATAPQADPNLKMWSGLIPDGLDVALDAMIVPKYREGALLLDPARGFPRIGIPTPALNTAENIESMRLQM